MRDKVNKLGLGEKYGLVILSEAKNQFGLRAFYSSCVVRCAFGTGSSPCVVTHGSLSRVQNPL